MRTFHDHGKFGLVVMDGKKLFARARPIRGSGWLLSAFNFSWIGANKPNVFNIINSRQMVVKTKREAKKILKDLVQ